MKKKICINNFFLEFSSSWKQGKKKYWSRNLKWATAHLSTGWAGRRARDTARGQACGRHGRRDAGRVGARALGRQAGRRGRRHWGARGTGAGREGEGTRRCAWHGRAGQQPAGQERAGRAAGAA